MMGDPPSDPRRRLGARGEQVVADRLAARGFLILARNLRARWGEIDIVARRGRSVWFVEVKSRSRPSPFAPTISRRQQHRLTRMAYRFLQEHEEPYDTVQFVLAAVSFDQEPPRVTWIERAFDGTF